MHKVNRANLPDMVSYIKRRLLADWSDINFIIGTNPEDYIELRFTMTSVDAPSGLKAYMGTLVDTDFQMIKYQLRKVTQFWGVKNNSKSKKDFSSKMESQSHGGDDSLLEVKPASNNDEDYMFYMLAPPWARHKDPILYLR